MHNLYFVYILSNQRRTTLYIGITNDLKRRVFEHKSNSAKGFTKKYNVHSLVYYEVAEDPLTAVDREKQLKAGSRAKKISLITQFNAHWKDLYDAL